MKADRTDVVVPRGRTRGALSVRAPPPVMTSAAQAPSSLPPGKVGPRLMPVKVGHFSRALVVSAQALRQQIRDAVK